MCGTYSAVVAIVCPAERCRGFARYAECFLANLDVRPPLGCSLCFLDGAVNKRIVFQVGVSNASR